MCTQVRQQLLAELAKMEVISERIRSQCWGAMAARGSVVAGLKTPHQVWSLPLEATPEEEQQLQQVGIDGSPAHRSRDGP